MTEHPPSATDGRTGDPLEGLWTWRDHPVARVAFVIAALGAALVIFPLLAQITF